MKRTKARAPMLVMRTLHNTDLETRERMSVEALAKGFATKHHYDTLLDMQGLLILAGSTDKHRTYALRYAEDVVGPVLLGIKARYEKTAKLGCSGPELKVLKDFVEFYKQFWLRQPIELYKAACDELQKFYDGLRKQPA